MFKWVKMKKIVLIVGLVFAAGALGYLIYSFVSSGGPYVLTMDQLLSKQQEYNGKRVRVEGYVAADTIDWTSRDYTLKFILVDPQKTAQRLTVFLKGEKQDPNKFIEGIKLMLEGKYQNGILIADTLNYECPSQYKDK